MIYLPFYAAMECRLSQATEDEARKQAYQTRVSELWSRRKLRFGKQLVWFCEAARFGVRSICQPHAKVHISTRKAAMTKGRAMHAGMGRHCLRMSSYCAVSNTAQVQKCQKRH